MGLALATFTTSLIYFGRFMIASFFTNIEDLQEILVKTFELVAFVEFFSCCQIWNQGFLKGLGKFN
jgi:Na+-driven multidrug efflux pump